jgi:hypothetical protein
MCTVQDFAGLAIGPLPSDWIMLASLAAFYAVQLAQRLQGMRAAAL